MAAATAIVQTVLRTMDTDTEDGIMDMTTSKAANSVETKAMDACNKEDIYEFRYYIKRNNSRSYRQFKG